VIAGSCASKNDATNEYRFSISVTEAAVTLGETTDLMSIGLTVIDLAIVAIASNALRISVSAGNFGAGSFVGCLVTGSAGGLTATPLSQTSFLPLLMQVNFLPLTIDVAFSFEHAAPAFAVAALACGNGARLRAISNRYERARFAMS
jgi:hypothetical protein